MEEILLEKQLEAHRLLRHDIINYLQVISGYQQIGHPEKASEYITKAIDLLRHYSMVAKIDLLLLQSLLIWYMARYNTDCEIISIKAEKGFTSWKNKDRELTGLIMRILYILEDKFKDQEAFCRISFTEEPEPRIDIFLNSKDGTLTNDLTELYVNLVSEEFAVRLLETKCDLIHMFITVI